MNISIVLGSTVIAAIFSGLVSYIISKRQGNLQYITSERKEWREEIRKIAIKLNGATYEETIFLLTKLKVRINAFGKSGILTDFKADAHIWELIGEIEERNFCNEVLALQQKQLINVKSRLGTIKERSERKWV